MFKVVCIHRGRRKKYTKVYKSRERAKKFFDQNLFAVHFLHLVKKGTYLELERTYTVIHNDYTLSRYTDLWSAEEAYRKSGKMLLQKVKSLHNGEVVSVYIKPIEGSLS